MSSSSPSVVQWTEHRFPKANAGSSNLSGRTKAPKGYRVKVVYDTIISSSYDSDSVPFPYSDAIFVNLFHKGEMIGYVDLVETTIRGIWETHSAIDEDHRNKGLSVLLYAKAFDIILRLDEIVMSSYSPSDSAKRTWTSTRLNERFLIKQEMKNGRERFRVVGRKTQRHQ